MAEEKKSLNLGSGTDYKKGWINLDNGSNRGGYKIDIKADINKGLPFKKNYFDVVLCSHILEHVHNVGKIFEELYRILKPDGKLIIKVPHISVPVALGFWQHKNYWIYDTIQYYANGRFEIQKRELRWKMPVHPISKIINKFVNINPKWSERYLANYIGGFEEIYMELQKKKDVCKI